MVDSPELEAAIWSIADGRSAAEDVARLHEDERASLRMLDRLMIDVARDLDSARSLAGDERDMVVADLAETLDSLRGTAARLRPEPPPPPPPAQVAEPEPTRAGARRTRGGRAPSVVVGRTGGRVGRRPAAPSRRPTTTCPAASRRSAARRWAGSSTGRPAPRRAAGRRAGDPGQGCAGLAGRGQRRPGARRGRGRGAVAGPGGARRRAAGGRRIDRADAAHRVPLPEPHDERRRAVAPGPAGQPDDRRPRRGHAGHGGRRRSGRRAGDRCSAVISAVVEAIVAESVERMELPAAPPTVRTAARPGRRRHRPHGRLVVPGAGRAGRRRVADARRTGRAPSPRRRVRG